MEEVRPTRSELLERKQQIRLAQQGMDLLKQKRDALLMEFMGVMDETLRLSESLQKNVSEAQYSLAVAKAVDGTVALRSAALATKGEIVIEMTGTKIMGVSVPVVTKGESPIKSSFTRGYSVTGVSSRVDETADKFERILDVIIEYADIETRLKRLGEEINKTNRRVNALEQVTVPALQETVTYIRQTLDERAREDLFRLKKVKRKIEKKKAAAQRPASCPTQKNVEEGPDLGPFNLSADDAPTAGSVDVGERPRGRRSLLGFHGFSRRTPALPTISRLREVSRCSIVHAGASDCPA